jgi:predicted DCC family thiol-disulfide oxidoreductase YuxK
MTTAQQFLIYDGDCAVCTRAAHWIERRWRGSPRPVAVSSQRVHDLWPALVTPTAREMNESLWWITATRREAGARAVARALLVASAPWRVLGALLATPPLSWMAAPLYALVARNRHRLPGASAACRRAPRE